MNKHLPKIQLLALFLIGFGMWFLHAPAGLSEKGWHLLIIFMLTIVGVIINPIPMSAVALSGMLACVLTSTLSIKEALQGFGSDIIWIVVLAFFIARGFIKTGLGKRIAYFFIATIGRTTLGLSYGFVITDFILSPMIPSVTARGGGVLYPIAKSVIDEYGNVDKVAESTTGQHHSIRKTGAFLVMVCFQSIVITSAMFVTAMAGNPLIVSIAGQMGIVISWSTWALGAIVPGLTCLAIMPVLVYLLCPPSIRESKRNVLIAKEELSKLGPLSRNEFVMIIVFMALILLWIFGDRYGISATTSALVGVVALLITEVITWDDAVSEKSAWDTMTWFAILLNMSYFLGSFGVMKWIGENISNYLGDSTNTTNAAVAIIGIYFYIHYFFASVTAHITVFYGIFLGLLINTAGMDGLPAALLLAYTSLLCGSLTHYGNSAAPIFYGAKYFTTSNWWKIGFIISTINLILWAAVSYVWWSALGWI